MANVDSPRGLRALRNATGTAPKVKQYDATTAVIYEGALVQLLDTGLADIVNQTEAASTAVKAYLGVAAHYKASAGATIQVYVDPEQLYVAQSDDASLDSLTDFIGANIKVVGASSGSTITGQSSMELDGSSASTASTADFPLRVVELFKMVGNAIGTSGTASSNADFVVRINQKSMHARQALGIL